MFAGVLVSWSVAWLLKVSLDQVVPSLKSEAGSFGYWTAAKVLCWILPSICLIRKSGRAQKEVLNLPNWRTWGAWGLGVGFLVALTGVIPKLIEGRPLVPDQLSFPYVSILSIAPVFEEYLVRGAVLGNLRMSLSFAKANTLSSLMFVAIHIPGWAFMGTLADNLTKPVGGAVSIFLLGLVFGYVVKRGDSVCGGMLAHSLNNFAS